MAAEFTRGDVKKAQTALAIHRGKHCSCNAFRRALDDPADATKKPPEGGFP